MPRGGYRPGAGRPEGTTKEENRVPVSFRVEPETKRKIAEEAEARGISEGKLLDLVFSRRKLPTKQEDQ